ncbi:MAG: Na+/H+ antiporter NhaC, partial [Halioglobus sp.]
MNNKIDENGEETLAGIEESASGAVSSPRIQFANAPYLRPLLKPAFWVIVLSLLAGLYVQSTVDPQWRESKATYQTYTTEDGRLAYRYKSQETLIHNVVPYAESPLQQSSLDQVRGKPELRQQWVYEDVEVDGAQQRSYSSLSATFHFGPWSLLPALVAVALCLMTKEPLSALLGGIVAGGFMLGKFDITDDILLPNLATESAAGVLMLYLWLLGGLMGIWSRTGAAQAFAEFMTVHFVRGPRSAKMVAWSLGVVFFQGGSVSTVLVGTTVRPLADKNNISHEELAYIVDSTAS